MQILHVGHIYDNSFEDIIYMNEHSDFIAVKWQGPGLLKGKWKKPVSMKNIQMTSKFKFARLAESIGFWKSYSKLCYWNHGTEKYHQRYCVVLHKVQLYGACNKEYNREKVKFYQEVCFPVLNQGALRHHQKKFIRRWGNSSKVNKTFTIIRKPHGHDKKILPNFNSITVSYKFTKLEFWKVG